MRQGETDPGRLRVLVLVLAGALCVGAAVLIVKVAGKSGIDLTGVRLIYIALALAVFSVNAMAGVHLAQRRQRWAPLGYLTAAVAVVGFAAFVVYLLDQSISIGSNGQLQAVLLAATLALAQISLVLAYDSAEDPLAVRLVSLGTVLVILVLGVLVAIEAAASSSDLISPKTFAIVATLYLLGAALTVLFRLATWDRHRARVGSVPLDHVVIAVSDRAAAVRFYTGLLGAEVVERPEGRIAFRVGEQLLNVHEPGLPGSPVARDPVRPGNSDLCFVWPAAPQLAVDLVGALGAELVEGPVPRQGAQGPGQSVYCRDPDGSLIELISYS
jgi:catechol 2,3-dioxygenase-like lactoylglutathione lyase family enzyme